MIFSRIASQYLEAWKSKSNRKPLIIRGARQVGKTTLVNEFARSYKYTILLNMEKSSDMEFFNKYTQVKLIIESLLLTNNISIDSIGETLLFIDEVQESPMAIQMLRYFYEEFPELHVIAAGSLLEFAMTKVRSLPVGRVEYLYLHPLNFREFLEAIDHHAALSQINKIPYDPFAYKTLLDLFNSTLRT